MKGKEIVMVLCSFCGKVHTPAKESRIITDKGNEYFMCYKCMYKCFGEEVYNLDKRV
jgi:hypothetical protein